jgi:hypothetical protein
MLQKKNGILSFVISKKSKWTKKMYLSSDNAAKLLLSPCHHLVAGRFSSILTVCQQNNPMEATF